MPLHINHWDWPLLFFLFNVAAITTDDVENGLISERLPTSGAVVYEKRGQSSSNILSYDTKTLITYGWIFPYRGSIFHRKIFGIILVQLVLSTCAAKYKCDFSMRHQQGYCIPLPDSMTALTLLTVTSFLVGLFTNNLMQRWWQIRTALNNVKSKSTNLINSFTASVVINVHNSQPHIRAQTIMISQTVKRYLQLAHALMYLRSNPKEEFGSQDIQQSLLDRKLVTPHEMTLLLSQQNASFDHRRSPHVYAWVLLCMEKAVASGVLGPRPGGAQHVVTLFNELSLIQSASV